jgi:hypothetical protein
MSQSKRSARKDEVVTITMTRGELDTIGKALWYGRCLALDGHVDFNERTGMPLPKIGRKKRLHTAYLVMVRASIYCSNAEADIVG